MIQRLVEILYAQGLVRHTLANPDDWKALDAKWMGLLCGANGKMRRIDILGRNEATPYSLRSLYTISGVPYDELGAALIYFTGNDM